MKNRKREICTSGTVRDEDGNILIYSANDRGDRGNVGIIRSPIRASILPDCGGRSVTGVPCTLPGVRQGDRICRIARKAVSLRRPFGDQARAVDPAPLFQAPLFRPDGVLGRVLAQILCTRSIDAGLSLEGIEERV